MEAVPVRRPAASAPAGFPRIGLSGAAGLGCFAAWLASRALLLTAPHWSGYPHRTAVTGDVRLYARWARILTDGHFPVDDPSWQYPPGAGLVLAVPRWISAQGYRGAFVVLMLLADAAVLAVLLWRARHGSTAGAWLWVVGTTALGPILLNRFDVVPTLFAVAALAVPARPGLAGALLGAGGVVKVWPALLLAATRDRGRALVAAALVGVATLMVLLGAGRLAEGLDFLGNQKARGLQVETVAATPYLLARAFGASGIRVGHEYGAYQVLGPGVSAAVVATGVAGLAVIAAYVALAWRRPGDLGLALGGLLAVLVTARVLSPQYLIWVLGVAAVELSTSGSRQRRTALLLVLAAGLTQWLYPPWYDPLLRGDLLPALLLTLRNAVLVAAAVVALRQGMTRPVETK